MFPFSLRDRDRDRQSEREKDIESNLTVNMKKQNFQKIYLLVCEQHAFVYMSFYFSFKHLWGDFVQILFLNKRMK